MGSKHIIFVLLAVVAIQGTFALRVERQDPKSIADLVGKAREGIQKLTNLVRLAVENAVNNLVRIRDGIVNIAKQIIDNTKNSISEEIQKIKDQIVKIKEQAEAVGVDVKECLKDNQSNLEEIPRNTVAQLLKCVTDQVDKVKDVVELTVAEVKAIRDSIVGLPKDLKRCIVSLRPVRCLSNLIADVVSSISSLPSLVTSKVQEIIVLITKTEGEVKACAIRKVLEASKAAADVGAQVARCVADKIREE